MSTFHEPVLVREAVDFLQVRKGRQYIDATAGGGGHTEEILKRGGIVLAIDKDQDAISELRTGLGTNKNLEICQGDFRNLLDIARQANFINNYGILFDLGVSSHQLDTQNRGFSMKFPQSVLDMRMNRSDTVTAEYIVNTSSEDELYEIFSRFGEEENARPISHAIIASRRQKHIASMNDFMDVVKTIVPSDQKEQKLARILQALRIAVNGELEALRSGLAAAKSLLIPKGRLVVISFHSLEDRIVKLFLATDGWKILTKKPLLPSYAEIQRNSRARSAKLRAAERL